MTLLSTLWRSSAIGIWAHLTNIFLQNSQYFPLWNLYEEKVGSDLHKSRSEMAHGGWWESEATWFKEGIILHKFCCQSVVVYEQMVLMIWAAVFMDWVLDQLVCNILAESVDTQLAINENEVRFII